MPQRPGWISLALSCAFAVFAVYAAVVLLTTPEHGLNIFVTRWLYQGLILASVAIAAARAVLVTRDRLAWIVIALALASNSFAELYTVSFRPEEYPSVADFGWIAFYPLLYVGMVLLLRRRSRSLAGTLWLDGFTASVAAAALAAAVVVEVVLRTTEGSLSAVATNLAYPLGDVLLLSAVFGVFSLAGWKIERRWLVLGLGVLATTVADAVYLLEVTSYQEGSPIDILWPASTLLIAGAAWAGTRERRIHFVGRPLLAVPAVCALVAIGILVVDHFAGVNLLAAALAATTLLLVIARLAITFRENAQLFELTHHESLTDALTGLGNRRQLMGDLGHILDEGHRDQTLLMIFDLDGFKGYNDSFGHPAGDALLARLGEKLAAVPGERGGAYRLGGDEFCLVVRVGPGEAEPVIDDACTALSERGEGFDVSTSFGAVMLPDEATDVSHALSLADERLYAQKHSRRGDGDRSMASFLEALADHEPDLQAHLEGVAALAVELGTQLGLRRDELDELSRAAQLHDIGKIAVPDEILRKPGPLDDREWEFIRQHTVVGERILLASPAFRSVAATVRSSHENWDGTGYPDGVAGEAIPLQARIIAACDAFSAMTSTRPYSAQMSVGWALEEILRCEGKQFDPRVARLLVSHVRERLESERAA